MLVPDAINIWGTRVQLVPISSMAKYLPAAESVVERIEVVAPSSIDQLFGHIQRLQANYRGPVYRVGQGNHALRYGDVLLQRSGFGPAFVITESVTSYAYSAQFHALRPTYPDLGFWLWAVLSSTPGLRARQAAQAGSRIPAISIAELLSLIVPIAGSAQTLGRLKALAELRSSTRLSAGKSSWWTIRDIPNGGAWAPRIFMKDPAVIDRGLPLHQKAQIVKGRRPLNPARVMTDDTLPVMEARVVTGSPPRWWSNDERLPRIKPGDVVVQAIGLDRAQPWLRKSMLPLTACWWCEQEREWTEPNSLVHSQRPRLLISLVRSPRERLCAIFRSKTWKRSLYKLPPRIPSQTT